MNISQMLASEKGARVGFSEFFSWAKADGEWCSKDDEREEKACPENCLK